MVPLIFKNSRHNAPSEALTPRFRACFLGCIAVFRFQGTYITGSANVISGTGTKWLGIHSGNTQIHLGKNNIDSILLFDLVFTLFCGVLITCPF